MQADTVSHAQEQIPSERAGRVIRFRRSIARDHLSHTVGDLALNPVAIAMSLRDSPLASTVGLRRRVNGVLETRSARR